MLKMALASPATTALEPSLFNVPEVLTSKTPLGILANQQTGNPFEIKNSNNSFLDQPFVISSDIFKLNKPFSLP